MRRLLGDVATTVLSVMDVASVVADWPGVKEANLFQNRDLKPTTDLRSVLKGLLRDHLHVEDRALTADIFPDSDAAMPIEGLLA